MDAMKPKSFPRGGRKIALVKSNEQFDFSVQRKGKSISKKLKSYNSKKKNEAPITQWGHDTYDIKYVEELNASTLQDGMLVLGIVSQINNSVVKVSLPGGLRGVISHSYISEFYKFFVGSETQSPPLQELFYVGDVLTVEILSVSEINNSLMVTCNPKSVNKKLSYNLIEKGFLLMGCIKSKEDHGYVIEFGIEHVKAFLCFDKVEPDKHLVIGQVIRCSVINCHTAFGVCNVKLSTLNEDIQSSVINKNSSLPFYCFIPGFQFEVSPTKVLIDGVEVNYSRDVSLKGYIHEDHLLKKFPNLSESIGSDHIGTLLYTKPFVNIPFFKIMPKKKQEWPFEYGEIVSGKVVKTRRSGVIFKVIDGNKKAKCFVPLTKLKDANKLLENRSLLSDLYPINKKVSKIRLINLNYMSRHYVGATDKASIEEKYFSVSDLKCGQIVNCVIVSLKKSSALLRIGKSILGYVKYTDMSDIPLTDPKSHFKEEQKVVARVRCVTVKPRSVRLTMKPTLLNEKEIMTDPKDFKKGKCYIGTIQKVLNKRLIVEFFNLVFGVIPKTLTPYSDSPSLTEYFTEGQLIKCTVVELKNNCQLVLSLFVNDSDSQLVVGKKYEGEVALKVDGGFFLNVEMGINKKCKGFLPLELLTPFPSLARALHLTYSVKDKFSVYCLFYNEKNGLPVLAVSEIFDELYEGKSNEDLEKMYTVGSVVPFLFKNKKKISGSIVLQNILPGNNNRLVRVVKSNLNNSFNCSKYQLIYGKIISIVQKKIDVSIKVSDVWDKDFNSSLNLLSSYLKAVSELVKRQTEVCGLYQIIPHLGSCVRGTVKANESDLAVAELESGDFGILKGKFSVGQSLFGKVVWIDAPNEKIFLVKTKESEKNFIKGHSSVKAKENLRGKVVFINEEVVIIELKGHGNGELAFLPKRRHLNDFLIQEPYDLFTEGEDIKVSVTRKDCGYLLAMDRRVVLQQKNLLSKKTKGKLNDSLVPLKKKLESLKLLERHKDAAEADVQVVSEKLVNGSNIRGAKEHISDSMEEYPDVKQEQDVDNQLSISNELQMDYDDVQIKSEDEGDEMPSITKEKPSCNTNNDERIILSSSSESEEEEEHINSKERFDAFDVEFNWNVNSNDKNSLLSGIMFDKGDSSEDEDDHSGPSKKKKRKLSESEKRELAKKEEERLRFIEERLMDESRKPETVDDYDRAVLGNPNSSALWLQYMVFHVQETEIEKARAVARRALSSISFRLEQERLNVWVALLNLENLYGTEETLEKTFVEALQVNDPYKVHFHMLNLHAQSNKLQEMERLGNFLVKKFSDVESMWWEVASVFYQVGKVESARHILQKALKAVDKNAPQVITKFAQLENKYGNHERAQTLFEFILSTFPKRIDIWSRYVDMLVKSNEIDLARQVLQRATSQTLRPRKMKILFKKFLAFEETHGSPETVEKVRDAAAEYVQTIGSHS